MGDTWIATRSRRTPARRAGRLTMPTRPPTLHERRRGRPALRERTTAASRFRSSARWQRFRSWYLNANPLCCDPFGEHKREHRVAAARCVHHIAGLSTAPHLGLDEDNAAALCVKCHGQLEALERRGVQTQQLFHKGDGGRGGVDRHPKVLSHPRPPRSGFGDVPTDLPAASSIVQSSPPPSNDLHNHKGTFHG